MLHDNVLVLRIHLGETIRTRITAELAEAGKLTAQLDPTTFALAQAEEARRLAAQKKAAKGSPLGLEEE